MNSFSSQDSDAGEGSPPPITFNGVLRASGKRFRRQFNPNDWTTSILTRRHNVLCLGMSYPCVETVIANYKGKKDVKIFHSAPSVERSVELVRRNLLNQIDGRDLARVVALEANNDILAYTVSKEEGAYYDQRHLHADFNSRTLVNQMHMRWGKTVKFRQVMLDYFWSPSGSWAIKHWQRSFFNENIPRLVTENMLNFGDLENDSVFVSALEANTAEDYISSTAAVVYLPFCSHCLSQVVACYDNLSQFYTISFLRKDQLDEHTLWKATNTISPESMRGWLAKTINQEELYCTVDIRQIKHGAGDASVTKEDILDVFNKIDRSDEVRMIKLTALRKFHPDYPKSDMQRARTTLGLNKGGYVGLLCKRPAAQKKVEISASVIPISKQIPGKKVLQSKQQRQMPRKRSISQQQLDQLAIRKRAKRDNSVTSDAPANDAPVNAALANEAPDNEAPANGAPVTVHDAPVNDALANGAPVNEAPANDAPANDITDAAPKTYVPSESSKEEPPALTGIALEWDRILTSFELDYRRQINKLTMTSPAKGQKTVDEVEYANQMHSNRSNHPNCEVLMKPPAKDGVATSEAAKARQTNQVSEALPISQGTSSAVNDSPSAPVAMMKIAQLRRTNPAVPGESSAKASREADNGDLIQHNEATPNVNDVLMGASHHSHQGNVQFFNTLSMCSHDFSMVADCFVGALKALDPPGRFLGKCEASGTWACIDYDEAINFVPYLLDNHNLNSPCDISSPSIKSSSAFLDDVQRFFYAKFCRGGNRSRFGLLSNALIAECETVAAQNQSISGEVSDSNHEPTPTSKESSDGRKLEPLAKGSNKDLVLSTREEASTTSKTKLKATMKTAMALVLAEYEETEKMDTSNNGSSPCKEREPFTKNKPTSLEVDKKKIRGTKLNASKKRGKKGRSPAVLLALAEETEKLNNSNNTEKVDTYNKNEEDGAQNHTPGDDDGEKDSLGTENNSGPSLSPMAAAAESTTITSTITNNASQMVINGLDLANPQTPEGMSSVNNQTAEEASFKSLAQWLQPTNEEGTNASMEIALKQISEQGNMSICKLLTHALEEEEALLRALCTNK